jgi:hypothetical protein
LKDKKGREDQLTALMNFYQYVLTSRDAYYENCFVILSTFAILKLDSFIKDSLMHTFINLMMTLAKDCSKLKTLSEGTQAVPFMVAIDKLF